MPYGAPCHADSEWLCAGCERVICAACEPSPGENDLCADCYFTDDPGDDAA